MLRFVENLKLDDHGRVPCQDVWDRYSAAYGVPVVNTVIAGRVLRKFFPSLNVSKKRNLDAKPTLMYRGISWKEKTHTELQLSDVPKAVKGRATCVIHQPDRCLLTLPTTSDKVEMVVQIDYTSMKWSLSVDGNPVNCSKLWIHNSFTRSKESIFNILTISQRIQMCTSARSVNCEKVVSFTAYKDVCKTLYPKHQPN